MLPEFTTVSKMLNCRGLDLEEQSKNLANQQPMQSRARARGRGGAVDMTVGSDVEFEDLESGKPSFLI